MATSWRSIVESRVSAAQRVREVRKIFATRPCDRAAPIAKTLTSAVRRNTSSKLGEINIGSKTRAFFNSLKQDLQSESNINGVSFCRSLEILTKFGIKRQ